MIVSRTSAYKIHVRTDSADSNALLLLDGGQLVAILVELADDCHGDACGHWIIETTFGLNDGRRPGSFACAADAANWISQHICHRPFVLDGDIAELR
ncbi:MAG: hypothetical protein ACR2KH_00100 [Sphingomicrobium sp.]